MSKQSDFIHMLLPLAIEDEKISKVPAEVTIGQAIQESAWGDSTLAKHDNNLFGIKAGAGWYGLTTIKRGFEIIKGRKVHEQMKWRKYPNIYSSIQDHGHFLQQNRYKPAFQTKSWLQFLTEIWKAGYATDPDYVMDIRNIIVKYEIDKQCEELRNAAKS